MDKKRSPELIAFAVRLYEELRSTQKVAHRLDIGASTAHRMLKAAGVQMPGRHDWEVQQRKKTLHGASAANAAADYASGMRMSDIEKKHGVGKWAILTAARDAGVMMRNRGGRYRGITASEKREATRLYKGGWSQAQIAAKFSMHQTMVSNLLRELGVQTNRRAARGKDHGSWSGGRSIMSAGYIGVHVPRDDPMSVMACSGPYVLEHRLVMARSLGRPLMAHETVHHINGDRKDNRLSNLQLRFGKHGNGVVMVCAKCGSHDLVYKEIH